MLDKGNGAMYPRSHVVVADQGVSFYFIKIKEACVESKLSFLPFINFGRLLVATVVIGRVDRSVRLLFKVIEIRAKEVIIFIAVGKQYLGCTDV